MPAVDHERLLDFLAELVRIPSVNRPQEGLSEAAAAELLAARMRDFGWRPRVEEAAPGRPNVFAIVDGGRPGPTLLFEGHTDVVTEGDPARWSHAPFGAVIESGRLYGRGSADMKAGVAAMVFAAAALRPPFPGRVMVAALADEEGMMLGVKDFVRRGHAAGVDGAIICEPEGGEVCTSQKGAIRVLIEIAGTMAHGAMPDHGRNPIPALADLVHFCAELEAGLQGEHGAHPHLGLPFVTPTHVAAGSPAQLNVIPGEASLGIDIRTIPAVDHASVIARLRAACGAHRTLTVVDDRPPTETSSDHPVVRAVADAHRQVYGAIPRYGGVPGSTDGTILWRDARVPIVTYGPGGKWIAHQVDEHVELEEVSRAADVYLEAARRFLEGG